ncbi:hypothetical protein E4U43_008631 [Claviceps pusilla]|uniref:WDR59/RTC1-like RING zinc finger domain-containing protein n=1 Tax=Claviceps pusilla TaxID=123648 RepID=A0A9P7SZV3_9HYPO|nr:hypothetical protein E4U43_008631 [Claviceps pusilla]
MESFDQQPETPKKGRVIKSAYDSESFESDGSIHVDGLVGSATISPSGRDIALASPDGLAIIDLDSPYNPPRRLKSHGLPWLVCDVQWSPFAARDYWVVSTANHRALVWNLNLREDSNSGAIEHSLQGHSRAITDINFSAHHPDTLATCSVDGYVHWWDLRRPRQPALTFCDWFAGATQVKFNRQDSHIIASAHDRFLHVWDDRNAAKPVKSISAHTSKIYGIDWNRTRRTGIATCSLDKTIRFWDYGKDEEKQLEHIVRTDFPVWRARHTPFGWGFLAMPQHEPGDLYLYDRLWSSEAPVEVSPKPVTVFSGHGDHKVKEFLWRTRGGISGDNLDHREFQLVSWGTDNELRLHCLDAKIYSAVGHVKDGPARKGLNLTRQGAAYKTFRTVDDSHSRDRHRKAGTMSDHKASVGSAKRKQSAISLGSRAESQIYRHFRSAWRGPSMKAKVDSGKHVDRSQAQLGWMKGITMTKRRLSSAHLRRHASKDHGLLGHNYPDDEWNEPDTIQEELLRISTQIPKVKWENIDMDNLTMNASLTGPWGRDGESIFVKVKIDIPSDYPKLKAPKFMIEKTSFMPEDTHKEVMKEVHMLADQFLQRKQNCLEVILTYLLGEVDLESSTSFFKNVRDFDDDLDGLADESSSEDDDDMPTSMSQELPLSDADTTLAPLPHRTIPPTPRTCGAYFSPDGRLVCFFPAKEKKPRTLFSTSAELYNKERFKGGEPVFAGFGRLTYDLLCKQKHITDEASATDDVSDESGSDFSSSSSSSGSGSTSIHKMKFWYNSSRQLEKAWSEDRSARSSGGGTGAGTGTGTGTNSRRRFGRPRNLIAIYDMRSDLPSKIEYAEEYAVFGDGTKVCEHNARVAEKYGNGDLVVLWRYLALILSKGVPLEVLSREHNQNSILVIARDVVTKTKKAKSPHSRAKQPSPAGRPGLKARVKWGQHPLAKELILELFDHFERLADTQMLGILSCVFSEPQADDDVAYSEYVMPQAAVPLPLKAPSFSLEYFPTHASARKWSAHSRSYTNSAVTTPATLHTPMPYAGSYVSEEDLWNGDPGNNSYSCGETPSLKGKSKLADSEPPPPAVSRSPSNRGILRESGGLASALTVALPKSFIGGRSGSGGGGGGGGSSTSPPNQGRKRPSPVEYIMSVLAPSAKNSEASTKGAANASGGSGGGKTSASDEGSKGDEKLPLVPTSVNIIQTDQSIFDDDGWLDKPLLDSNKAGLYARYRHAYAEMLQAWNQPILRLEVLKFNTFPGVSATAMTGAKFHDSTTLRDDASATEEHHKTGSSPIPMGKKDQLHNLIASGRGLDVTGICRIHETQLEPARYTSSHTNIGGATGSCDRCPKMQTRLACVYCLGPIEGLFSPCLSCGCAHHMNCLLEWLEGGETLCPAGDECNCAEEVANAQVESWSALRGAMMKRRNKPSNLLLQSSAIIDEDEFEDEDEGNDEFIRGRSDWSHYHSDNAPNLEPKKPLAPQSPAILSFGRLKQAGPWSRAASLRRASKRAE